MIRLILALILVFLTPYVSAGDECADFQALADNAELGDSVAQANLGEAYFFGMCVEADTDEAMYWYFRAAEAGSDKAVYAIGLAFSSGIGLDKNERLARHYFLRAANNGHEAATVNLANVSIDEQYGKCDGIDEIEEMVEKVTSPGIRVLFDQPRFDQLKAFCSEHGEKIRSIE
tara:strand:+ start:420 stop:941 length:522 start_codon:yes stop_codon:yes gene_type:complete